MKKTHNTTSRLLLGFFLPAIAFAFIAALSVSIGINIPYLPPAFGSITGLIGLILSSWILGGIQCMIYSVLMEFVVNPKLKNDRLAICISGLLVSIATWTVPRGFPFFLLVIGFITGCIVGWFLRDIYKYYS